MTGCQTCGGYGMKHDLAAHLDSGEDVRVTYVEGGSGDERGRFLSIAQRAETLARDAKLDPGMYPDPAEGFRWAAQAIRDAIEEAWPQP